MTEVSRILDRVQEGDSKAAEELLPLVYNELRRLAAAKLAHEAPGNTLQPTALVHEAWLRLVGDGSAAWNGRRHFMAAAAEAMRRILIDSARRKHRLRRGGGAQREELAEDDLILERPTDEVLAVHEALDALAQADALAAEFVKLHYFMGMTLAETADALKISRRTADRLWTYARSWLRSAIEDAGSR